MALPNFIPRRKSLKDIVLHFEDPDFATEFPALYQLLCHAQVDGHYRAGARLSLFCDDGKLKASVWDPDSNQVWFATLEGFKGSLEAVEAMLSQGRGEWRERKPGNGKH